MKYQIKQRMDFISDTLKTKGCLNRADVMQKFGISVAQAGIDIREYAKFHPKAMRYDLSKKTYVYTGSIVQPTIQSPKSLHKTKETAAQVYSQNRSLVDSIAQYVRAQVEFGSDIGLEGMISLGIADANNPAVAPAGVKAKSGVVNVSGMGGAR